MNEEKDRDTGGLRPQYWTYERQKCFIAYTEQANWSDDLLSACTEILSRPEFNLEPDYARKHFDPDIPLRQKALELIANARYGIYDLSYWQDEKCEWHMPRNVYIELGLAIALNRPTLLLRHASNQELDLPECLQSISGHILEFSGETTLKRALEEHLPRWVNASPERDWWSRYCIFGGRTCEYREVHPRSKQWGQETLCCHISDGSDVDRPDFRGVVEYVLGRFSDVTFDYLDALPVTKGYDFILCTHCQTVRSTPFAIYRITPQTQAETFIAIGMSIALEAQFEYKISKILLAENVQDVPSLLSGYEIVMARSDRERKDHLRIFLPTVIKKVRQTVWMPRPLPFTEVSVLLSEVEITTQRIEVDRKSSIRVDLSAGRVWVADRELNPPLSPAQYRLLVLLFSRQGGVVNREEVASAIWSKHEGVSDLAIDALVHRLRKRIAELDDETQYVTTIRGRGYRLENFVIGEVQLRDHTAKAEDLFPDKQTILIAEDDRDTRELFAFIFREASSSEIVKCKYKYTVFEAINGPQAVQIVRDEPIDLAILDIRMPLMDGYEAARLIGKEAPDIPIVFLTAKGLNRDVKRGYDCTPTVVSYIRKPVTPDELINRIEQVLEGCRTRGIEAVREENMVRDLES